MVIFGIHFTAIDDDGDNNNTLERRSLKKNTQQTEANNVYNVCIRLHMVKWFGLAFFRNEKKKRVHKFVRCCSVHFMYSRFA